MNEDMDCVHCLCCWEEGKAVIKVGGADVSGGPVRSHVIAINGLHSVQCTVLTGPGDRLA